MKTTKELREKLERLRFTSVKLIYSTFLFWLLMMWGTLLFSVYATFIITLEDYTYPKNAVEFFK
jgi:hypothetical protein